MKIERISDNQVKFFLSQTDLQERDIRVTELAYGSEKTQELFREMMEQAMVECDFHADNTPLMIEAIPVAGDSIMIIVTKVVNSEEMENKFGLFPKAKEATKFKRKSIVEEAPSKPSNVSIFSFSTLDDVTSASVRIFGQFDGESFLFKEQNRYFLILETQAKDEQAAKDVNFFENLDTILSEYGQKHISTYMSNCYIFEHGEPLINSSAVNILSSL